MSARFGVMYTIALEELTAKDDKLWDLHQNSSVDNLSPQKYVFFFKSKNIDSHIGDKAFEVLDGTPLWNFADPTRRFLREKFLYIM